MWLVEWPKFDWFIIFCIIVASICLAIHDYSEKAIDYNLKLDAINWVLSGVFLTEAVIKITAYGFVMQPKSYLRNTWNVIDFTIVLVSLLEIALSLLSINGSFLRPLRTLRALRPLRSFTAIPSLRK